MRQERRHDDKELPKKSLFIILSCMIYWIRIHVAVVSTSSYTSSGLSSNPGKCSLILTRAPVFSLPDWSINRHRRKLKEGEIWQPGCHDGQVFLPTIQGSVWRRKAPRHTPQLKVSPTLSFFSFMMNFTSACLGIPHDLLLSLLLFYFDLTRFFPLETVFPSLCLEYTFHFKIFRPYIYSLKHFSFDFYISFLTAIIWKKKKCYFSLCFIYSFILSLFYLFLLSSSIVFQCNIFSLFCVLKCVLICLPGFISLIPVILIFLPSCPVLFLHFFRHLFLSSAPLYSCSLLRPSLYFCLASYFSLLEVVV